MTKVLDELIVTTKTQLYYGAGNTCIRYTKELNELDNTTVEKFILYDPKAYPDSNYSNAFSANVTILRDKYDTYPQISVNAGNQSFAVSDGIHRPGESDLYTYRVTDLNPLQLERYTNVYNIMRDTLPAFLEQRPGNSSFLECASSFGADVDMDFDI